MSRSSRKTLRNRNVRNLPADRGSLWRVVIGTAACAAMIMLLGACRSAGPVPTTQMAQARTAVQQAEEAGATEHAGMEYRRAQQKLQEAQTAIAGKKHAQARRLAEQAAVDAELAAVKARSAKTQQAVNELRESIRALQEEAARGGN